MSNDEGHTDLFESHRADLMEHDKEDNKNIRKSKRMEEKMEKPKRHYKKRTPKPTAAATASPVQQQQQEGGGDGGESKPNRNRITKRDHGTSKKRTRPTKPPVLEAELLNPTGGPSKILQLDPLQVHPHW